MQGLLKCSIVFGTSIINCVASPRALVLVASPIYDMNLNNVQVAEAQVEAYQVSLITNDLSEKLSQVIVSVHGRITVEDHILERDDLVEQYCFEYGLQLLGRGTSAIQIELSKTSRCATKLSYLLQEQTLIQVALVVKGEV